MSEVQIIFALTDWLDNFVGLIIPHHHIAILRHHTPLPPNHISFHATRINPQGRITTSWYAFPPQDRLFVLILHSTSALVHHRILIHATRISPQDRRSFSTGLHLTIYATIMHSTPPYPTLRHHIHSMPPYFIPRHQNKPAGPLLVLNRVAPNNLCHHNALYATITYSTPP